LKEQDAELVVASLQLKMHLPQMRWLLSSRLCVLNLLPLSKRHLHWRLEAMHAKLVDELLSVKDEAKVAQSALDAQISTLAA
jgi:hypothetical protein